MYNTRVKELGKNAEEATQLLLALCQMGYYDRVIDRMKIEFTDGVLGADVDSREFREFAGKHKFVIQYLEALRTELRQEQQLRLAQRRS